MIERYSRKIMRDVWTEENKFSAYLEVEILSCETWSELGVIPKEDVEKIRAAAAFKVGFEEVDIAVTACAFASEREKRPFALGAAVAAATPGAFTFQGLPRVHVYPAFCRERSTCKYPGSVL